jgi:hypothetical protein
MGFDPTTGEPPRNFDPVTGKPVPRFDSTTGKPLRPREAALDHTPRLMVYAPYARRVVAWLVDAVLVMAPLTAILYFAVGPDPQTGQAPSEVKFVILPLLPLYSAILHAV